MGYACPLAKPVLRPLLGWDTTFTLVAYRLSQAARIIRIFRNIG